MQTSPLHLWIQNASQLEIHVALGRLQPQIRLGGLSRFYILAGDRHSVDLREFNEDIDFVIGFQGRSALNAD
jgi:hypothetical protein